MVGTASPGADTASIAQAAGINSLGNVASRVLGLAREAIIAGIFGASGATSAFDAVSTVPKMVYELLIGGMLSAALVPVLSEYAEDASDQRELEEILSILLTLGFLLLAAVTLLLELAAPWIAPLLVGGFDPQLISTATRLVRLIVPAILIYGLSGLIQAYHYARQRFFYPAMGAPAHNLGVIVAVVLLAGRLDIAALSIGILVAALFQLGIQLPGLIGTRIRWSPNWRHPAVQRILALYLPVLLSIVVQNVGIIIDRNLASRTVNEAITWMNKATFLIQLPLGLVSMAISLAVLPTLSQIDAGQELARFKQTLSRGLRLVLVLIIPAGVGLFVIGRPIIQLIFQHGAFGSIDTQQTLMALRYYLPGLPFSAIDLPLVFAFYAQKDTKTPVFVGIAAVLLYLATGPLLAFVLNWGFLGLVAANSIHLIGHALIMLVVFVRRFGELQGYGIARAAGSALLASLPLAGLCHLTYRLLAAYLPQTPLMLVVIVGLCIALGGGIYLLAARLLHMREIEALLAMIRERLIARPFERKESR